MVQVRVKALLVDTSNNAPVVLLEGDEDHKVMPIWIGQNEALAISLKLQEKEFERPLTHDLLKSVLDKLSQDLERVVIDDLSKKTYYATLELKGPNGQELKVDSRPSDSIALALRTDSPIFVDDEIFDDVAMDSPFDEEEIDEQELFENSSDTYEGGDAGELTVSIPHERLDCPSLRSVRCLSSHRRRRVIRRLRSYSSHSRDRARRLLSPLDHQTDGVGQSEGMHPRFHRRLSVRPLSPSRCR